tara:strand:+ start:633 stop:1739 length:1107 start_codon:yes stop_codon:yes gene_type:complete
MIANLNGLLKPTLFLFFILNFVNAKAGIKSVELVFDKTTVFKGNSTVFSLKVTKSSGNVFHSTDAYPKYPCQDFTYKITKGIQLMSPSKESFTLIIPEDYAADSITIAMQLSYASYEKIYKFKIPIYKAVDHVKSLLLYIDSIIDRKSIPFRVFADLGEEEGLEIQKRKTRYDAVKIQVLSGGKYDSKNAYIIPEKIGECNSQLVVRVSLIDRPKIFTDEVFTIKKNDESLPFSGIAGIDGDDGVTPTVKRDGTDGSDGWSGVGYSGNGGDGENGGNGGNVGNGGNGAHIKIMYSPNTEIYVRRIKVFVNGGLGGNGGDLGRYGKKGLAGAGSLGNGVMGRNGKRGTNGLDGKFEFITVSDYNDSMIK